MEVCGLRAYALRGVWALCSESRVCLSLSCLKWSSTTVVWQQPLKVSLASLAMPSKVVGSLAAPEAKREVARSSTKAVLHMDCLAKAVNKLLP